MILTNLILTLAIVILIWRMRKLSRQVETSQNLSHIIESILTAQLDASQSTLQQFDRWTVSITDHLRFFVFALQNLSVSMMPYIEAIMEEASDDEDYHRAEECKRLLENLTRIANVQQIEEDGEEENNNDEDDNYKPLNS